MIYTDGDRKKADEARGYFERAGVVEQITLKTGDALELLSEQKEAVRHYLQRHRQGGLSTRLQMAIPRLRRAAFS